MHKNVVGDWGANLSDRDYGRALAAMGVLEANGTQQHQASADPQEILAALREEFKDGERTALWRGAFNTTGATAESWLRTIHQDTQALAEAWGWLLERADHPRQRPRLAVDGRMAAEVGPVRPGDAHGLAGSRRHLLPGRGLGAGRGPAGGVPDGVALAP